MKLLILLQTLISMPWRDSMSLRWDGLMAVGAMAIIHLC
jgi:hypothetical protein